jgi:hypothetical protein
VRPQSTRGGAAVAALWGKSAFRLTAALAGRHLPDRGDDRAARANGGGTDNHALNVGVRLSW